MAKKTLGCLTQLLIIQIEGGVVAIKKTWSSIINYCEKIRQKLYTSPRGKQTCMG